MSDIFSFCCAGVFVYIKVRSWGESPWYETNKVDYKPGETHLDAGAQAIPIPYLESGSVPGQNIH
jgi:hypothetical protein